MNRKLILSIVLGILVIVGLVWVTTQTSLFNEDKRLVNKVNNKEKNEVIETKVDVDLPKELEDYATTPDEDNYKKLSKAQKNLVDNHWNMLHYEDGESSLQRDMKTEAKNNLYKSIELYAKEKGKDVDTIIESEPLLLSDKGFGEHIISENEDAGLYYSNTFKDLGGIRIEGIWIGELFDSIYLHIRNTSNKLITSEELLKNVEIEVVNGASIKNNKMRENKDYTRMKKNIESYYGVGLVKKKMFLLDDKILDGVYNVVGEDTDLNNYPSELKVNLKYQGDSVSYTLKKSKGGNTTSFNEEEELRLRN